MDSETIVVVNAHFKFDEEYKQPRPRAGRPDKWEWYVPAKCPTCGEWRDIPRYHARRFRDDMLEGNLHVCGKCQRSFAGSIGMAVALERHPDLKWKLFDAGRQRRLENPSSLEKVLMEVLNDLRVNYQREAYWQASTDEGWIYTADFFIRSSGGDVAVEANGDYWHSLPRQKVRDRRKRTFFSRRGIRLVELSETQITSGEAREILIAVLNIKREV